MPAPKGNQYYLNRSPVPGRRKNVTVNFRADELKREIWRGRARQSDFADFTEWATWKLDQPDPDIITGSGSKPH